MNLWTLAADTASPPTLSPLDFLQYGVLGLVIVALLCGWLWAKPSVDQLRADKAAVELQRDALIMAYESQVIPVLTDVQREFVPATSNLADALKILRAEAAAERREMRKEVARLRSDIAELKQAMEGRA